MWCNSTSPPSTSTCATSRTGASPRSSAPRRGFDAGPPSTSAMATASRPTMTGKRRSASTGPNIEEDFPALAASRIDQVSLECRNARVPIELIGLLKGKDVMVGCIDDVASNVVETPQEVADTIRAALDHVPPERLYPCTNSLRRRWRRRSPTPSSRRLQRGPSLRARRCSRGPQAPVRERPRRQSYGRAASARVQTAQLARFAATMLSFHSRPTPGVLGMCSMPSLIS